MKTKELLTRYLFTLLIVFFSLSMSAQDSDDDYSDDAAAFDEYASSEDEYTENDDYGDAHILKNVYNFVEEIPNDQLYDGRDYVTNHDGIISAEAEAKINQIIQEIKDSTSAEIAVVLVYSIEDNFIDDFATELFNYWGIGDKEKNNGLLFLLVYEKNRMTFRTGYGLEGVLPDAIAYRIISTVIAPELREGRFDEGIVNGIERVRFYLTDPAAAEEIKALKWEERKEKFAFLGFNLAGLLVFGLIFFLIFRTKKTKPQQYKVLKYFGFISLFFALLFQSLIIVSILSFLLRRWVRNKQPDCPRCGRKMKKLNEKDDNAYLNTGQDKEEKIGSIDYDVWLCECGYKEILAYKKMSKYRKCPNCDFRTYYVQSRKTLKRATTSSTGLEELTYFCRHCGATKTQQRVIPKVSESSSSGGGGSSGGSSGGSWGGGSSGGGGASGGW